MKTFYAKLSIDYRKKSCRNVIVSVPTFGENEEKARDNVERMIGNWQDVVNFTILKISTTPIFLTEYDIRGTVKFKNSPNKDLFFRVKAESRNEAEKIFSLKTGRWKGVVSRVIKSITIY
jgi:hypothetical protein